MFTSNNALYINDKNENISPLTCIESLYYEEGELLDNNYHYKINRKAFAKHMPVMQLCDNKVINDFYIKDTTDNILNITDTLKLNNEDIYIQSYIKKSSIPNTNNIASEIKSENLFNLSDILFNYSSKYEVNSSLNTIIKKYTKECKKLLTGLDKNLTSLKDISINLDRDISILNNNIDLYNTFINPVVYNIINDYNYIAFTITEFLYLISKNNLLKNRYYYVFYNPNHSRIFKEEIPEKYYHCFILKILAIDSNKISNKVTALSIPDLLNDKTLSEQKFLDGMKKCYALDYNIDINDPLITKIFNNIINDTFRIPTASLLANNIKQTDYFKNAKLYKWVLEIELINNENEYISGIKITKMIDEFNNYAPFDFKNTILHSKLISESQDPLNTSIYTFNTRWKDGNGNYFYDATIEYNALYNVNSNFRHLYGKCCHNNKVLSSTDIVLIQNLRDSSAYSLSLDNNYIGYNNDTILLVGSNNTLGNENISINMGFYNINGEDYFLPSNNNIVYNKNYDLTINGDNNIVLNMTKNIEYDNSHVTLGERSLNNYFGNEIENVHIFGDNNTIFCSDITASNMYNTTLYAKASELTHSYDNTDGLLVFNGSIYGNHFYKNEQ